MKGRINREGRLVFVRGGNAHTTLCPFQPSLDVPCGIWCALFGDPKVSKFFDPNKNAETVTTTLSLCHKTLKFDEFKDEREGK